MAKDVREWFDEAVLTVGSPLRLGQTVDQRKALLFENEVQHDHDVYHTCYIFIVSIKYFLSSSFAFLNQPHSVLLFHVSVTIPFHTSEPLLNLPLYPSSTYPTSLHSTSLRLHLIQIIAVSYSADFRIQHGRIKIIFENKNREEQDLRHLVVVVNPSEALTVKTLPPPSTIEGACQSLTVSSLPL